MAIALSPGAVVGGKYRLERTLGRGGMGAVWIAVQEPLGRRVALKLIDDRASGDAIARNRFEREAKAIAGLAQPNVVTLFDFGVDTDAEGHAHPWYAMELLDGESLRGRVRRLGRIPWRDSLPIMIAVARALRAAHGVGVVHRDIKPENVMLARSSEGEVTKVVDFGVVCLARADIPTVEQANRATASSDDHQHRLTGEGAVTGTPGFIPPEAVLAGQCDDPRGDLYALGVTWFEMLTGVHPFEAKSATALVMTHATQPRPALRERAPDIVVPHDVEALVQRLMAIEPRDRPASAALLIDELTRIANADLAPEAQTEASLVTPRGATATATAAATPATQPTQPTQPTLASLPPPDADAKRSWAAARALLVVAVLTGIFAVAFSRLGPRETNSDEPVRGGTLKVGLERLPGKWAPYDSAISAERIVGPRYLWQPLVEIVDGDPKPRAVAQWIEEGARGLRLTLRRGARFHPHALCTPGGRAADAHDLAASIHDRKAHVAPLVVEDVRVDGEQVVLTFAKPSPRAITYFDDVMLLPKELFASPPCDDIKALSAPVGTGPFRVATVGDPGSFTIERAPGHDDVPPYVDAITFKIIPTPLERIEAFSEGRIDMFPLWMIDAPPGVAMRDGKVLWRDVPLKDAVVVPVTSTTLFSSLLVLNVGPGGVFEKREVREAFAASVDRAAYWRALELRTAPDGLHRVVPPTLTDAPGRAPATPTADENALRSAIAARDVTISYTRLRKPVDEMCAALDKLGARCQPLQISISRFTGATSADGIDALPYNYFHESDDAYQYLENVVGAAVRFGADKALFDPHLKALATEMNPTERLRLVEKIEDTLLRERFVVPMGHASDGNSDETAIILRPTVQGIRHPVTGRMNVASPDQMYVPPVSAWLSPNSPHY